METEMKNATIQYGAPVTYSYSDKRALSDHVQKKKKNLLEFCIICALHKYAM
jgi:hypothetical protein